MAEVSEYAFTQVRGVKAPTPEQMEEYAKVLLAVVGADGEISPREWEFLENHARSLGASDKTVERWRAFDFKGANLEALTKSSYVKTRARAILYDAIRAARADSVYAVEEKAAAARVAKLLGVEHSVLAAIEGLVEMELSMRTMRSALLFSA